MENETKEIWKSTALGILAVVALVCWLKFQPRVPTMQPREKIGKPLFSSFNDPNQMTRIEFERIDPRTGNLQSLVLSRSGNAWLLPTMNNFPAENSDRISKIIAPLMQLSILDASDNTLDSGDPTKTDRFHRACGLLNPKNFDPAFEGLPSSSKENSEGVNLAQGSALVVKIEGEGGESLVDLLIGNRVPESSATRDARFVRFADEDVVYTVDFSGDSTQEDGTTEFTEFPERVSFEPLDWIDKDLLRISRWDALYLTVRDYAFSLDKTDDGIEQAKVQQNGIAIFKQTPENSISRVWSLQRLLKRSSEESWINQTPISPEWAQNEALNDLADAIGALGIVGAIRKSEGAANCFRSLKFGVELTRQSESLAEFGFGFFDSDPLNPQNINPLLVGEGGAIELNLKSGVKIVLIFGKKIDDKRACLVYSFFDRKALEESLDDEAEVEFQTPESQQKAELKNARFADWYYFVSEEDYQRLHFRLSEIVKQP